MKLCCFGDLHYIGDKAWLNNYFLPKVSENCAGCDAAVIVGDVSGTGRLEHVRELLLGVKRVFQGPIIVVPGNHDIYVLQDEQDRGLNSLIKLSMFNSLVRDLGCVALMLEPYVLNDVGFVGSIGWYDYTYAPDYLGLKIEDFRKKEYGFSVWMDKFFAKFPFSDEEFTFILVNRLEEDIRKIYDKVNVIVAVFHHVPFRKMVKYKLKPGWDYFSTFMGSEAFGYLLTRFKDKVKLALHGHAHEGSRRCVKIKGIKVCNCANPIPITVEV